MAPTFKGYGTDAYDEDREERESDYEENRTKESKTIDKANAHRRAFGNGYGN